MASSSVLPPATRRSLEAAMASGLAISTAPITFSSSSFSSWRCGSRRGVHVPSPRRLPSSSSSSCLPASSTTTIGDASREVPSSLLKQRSKSCTSYHLGTSSSDAGGLVVGGEPVSEPVSPAAASGDDPECSGGKFVMPIKRRDRSLKSFGKLPLWRRVFFASKKVRSVILLNVLTIIYASDIPVLKEVEGIVDPALFSMVRFALSALPFLPFAIWAHGDVKICSAGIELGCWVSLGYLAQALGLLTSDAGRASFISALTVITVPLLDGFFGSTIPALTWCGALISLVGVAMLESSGSSPSVGDLLNMLSAVFFGIHMLRTEQISRVTKKEKYPSLLGYQVIVIALFSTIWYFLRGFFVDLEEVNSMSWAWSSLWTSIISFPWIPALYTGIFSTGLCLWAEMSAMRDVSATETALIYGLEPLWGASFAWILLDERWDTIGWIGAALILGGSLTVQILGSPPEKSREDGSSSRQLDHLNISDCSKDLTFSTVVISSRKNVRNPPQKQDKL